MTDPKIATGQPGGLGAVNTLAMEPNSVHASLIRQRNAAILRHLNQDMDRRGIGIVDNHIATGAAADGEAALAFVQRDPLSRLHMIATIQNLDDDYGVHLIDFT